MRAGDFTACAVAIAPIHPSPPALVVVSDNWDDSTSTQISIPTFMAPLQIHTLYVRVTGQVSRLGYNPLANARVSWHTQVGRNIGPDHVLTTDRNGDVVLTGPTATHWEITVEAAGYKSQSLPRSAGDATDSVTFMLKRN
jgi:hypothetical protein